jgi:hypothetical protein
MIRTDFFIGIYDSLVSKYKAFTDTKSVRRILIV